MAFQLLFQRRNILNRKDRVFRDRTHPLELYDDMDLIKRYRMPRHCLLNLIDVLSEDLKPPTMRSHSIPATLQVLAALRYYATGSFQQVVADLAGLSQPSISRIVTKTSRALAQRANLYIKFPTTPEEQLIVKRGFSLEFNMPNTLGCVDGTLRPNKIICMVPVTSLKKIGSVGRDFFFTLLSFKLNAADRGSCHVVDSCSLRVRKRLRKKFRKYRKF